MIDNLRQAVKTAPGPLLLVEDGSSEIRRLSASLPPAHARWVVGGGPEPDGTRAWKGVALLVRDRQSLRRVVSALPDLGRTPRVWCWIDDSGGWAPVVVLRPQWPRAQAVIVRTSAVAAFTAVEFTAGAPVREVLIGIARGSSTQRNLWSGQPLLAAAGPQAARWLPASPDSITGDDVAELVSGDRALAADALLLENARDLDPSVPLETHAATGRAVVPVAVGRAMSWGELDGGTPVQHGMAAPLLNQLSTAPIDERVINPVGFDRDWSAGVVPLIASLRSPDAVTVALPTGERTIDLAAGVKDSDIAAMRCLQGVDVTWRGGHGPQAYARGVAALAMAGVPLTRTTVPRWAAHLLEPGLVRELEAPASLDDRLGREERSVRLRRAALRTHSIAGWRRRLARSNGLPEPRDPSVSVLLATRRPEMVGFALRQVAKQRHAGGEVILATHGFEPDDAAKRALDDAPGWELRCLPQPQSTPFGIVLNRAAEHASGDVLLKMDDDDWYGPHFVADLLAARAYSGAEIVGTPAEFLFLAPLWRTVRRPDFTERFSPIVAGGTIMIDRTTFAEVGGFRPVRRAVDAGLLAAVREGGGSVYRAHGLGYLLRRDAGGHTWDPGLGYFLASARVTAQWHGFRPSGELAVGDEDMPVRRGEPAGTMTGDRP
jgi:hypothetical protein